jgi:hypothetical protein
VLAALAWHNYARFGDVLDTGFRASAQEAVERRFFSPVDGVSGLLFSAGKGLFLFCPIVIPSLLLWPAFHRRHGLLSWFILAAALSRLLLVGAFRDWHGGFCLGPRYLVNALPFLLLPLAVRVADLVRHGTARGQGGMLLVAWAALCQQVYFGMGEIFSFLYRVKWAGLRVGGDVFKDDFLYFNWTVSPLWRLFEGQRGPYLLRRAALGDGPLFVTLCGLGLLGLLWAWVRACGRAGQRQTAAAERAG